MVRPPFPRAVAVLLIVVASSAVALGGAQLKVDAGWGGSMREGRWTPLFVTASDSVPRNVTLEVEWPAGGSYTMHIQQRLTISPTPRTFRLLVPGSGWQHRNAQFMLIDHQSGKTLAQFPKEPGTFALSSDTSSASTGAHIGASGVHMALETLQLATQCAPPGFLDASDVPDAPVGFDGLDILVLCAPNLALANLGPAALSDVQQQAIVDWVRAGGALIVWPGEGGFPSASPLVDMLPAAVGERRNINLSNQDLRAIGLPERFHSIAAFQLSPKSGAQKRPLLNGGQASAYVSRLGLGQIVLVPFDIAELPGDTTARAVALWKPLVEGMPGIADNLEAAAAQSSNPPGAVTYSKEQELEMRENEASSQIANFLGDVPGAGRFGFGYIAIVLAGMMIVVGPLDWFVLKRLGLQPWTWVTTGTCVALVTIGATFAGYLVKSGVLDYKTLHTIDQVGDTSVASMDYLSLYSSRTRSYEFQTDEEQWWRPGGFEGAGGSEMQIDTDFHQTQVGNVPLPMVVNVWSLRFLRQERIGAGPPIISTALTYHHDHVVGTVTNLTDLPLKNLHIAVRDGTGAAKLSPAQANAALPTQNLQGIGRIAPHATVHIDALIVPTPQQPANDNAAYNYRYYGGSNTEPTESELWKSAADLNSRRGRQMEALVGTGKFAIVYAEVDHPPPAAVLVEQQAQERHYSFVRALVELQEHVRP